MPAEIHVACRRDPSQLAALFQSCRSARVELAPARTIRAWSPRAHSTLLVRERDLAAVVTFHCHGASELACEYAELVARAFEGVVVIDGEVVELAVHDVLGASELAVVWHHLQARVGKVLEEQQRDKQRKRRAWELAQPSASEPATERDWSSV